MPKIATSKFVPPSDYCRESPIHYAEKLAERTTGWPMPDFVSKKRRSAGAMGSESGQDREASDCEDNLLRTGLTAKTAVAHSSRTGNAAVHGDPPCRFAADIHQRLPMYSGTYIREDNGNYAEKNSGVQAPLGSSSDEDIDSRVLVKAWQDNQSGRDCLNTFSAVAPWENMSRSNVTYHPQLTAARSLEHQFSTTPKSSKGSKALPDWVHPKWTKTFLPTLTHALYISKDPLEESRSSSPTFLATVEMALRLVYPNVKYKIIENDVLVEEAARRLAAKRSRISAAVMEEVKHFFEQPQFALHPDEIKSYARWALLPDGPAFQEHPTPITCTVRRGHEGYIQPAGTFRSPFLSKVAKHFLPQAKGSVLEPAICAVNPPKGLYALLLVSVERAFTAFKSGSYVKPKEKFCRERYQTHVETYISHLEVSRRTWEEILCQVTATDMNTVTMDEVDASSNRRNLVVIDLE